VYRIRDTVYGYLCVLLVGEAFNVGLKALFGNVKDWKRIREKAGEVNRIVTCTAVAMQRLRDM
jgi:hypothetical protein